MSNIEEKLKKLEEISSCIKQSDISLEDALKSFEDGIKLAKGLEAEIANIEGKIQKLMNMPAINEEESNEDVNEEANAEKKVSKKKASKKSKETEEIKAPRSDEELELSLFSAPELES
ncbi:MAG: exodeoxyribonuclease VII small subunit [Treponema sp.]|nr:exodeoxyribonuclease VII small subunit [Treponema sp.]